VSTDPQTTAPDTALNPDGEILLIDGYSLAFRAFFALPETITRSDGMPTNALYGLAAMTIKVVEEERPSRLIVAWDPPGPTFRDEIYPEYKAHRPEAPPELVPQFALVREATRAFAVPAIEVAGFEADDLIATYARRAREAGAEVTIVSSDKDLMQLIRPGVRMYDPLKSKPIGEDEVREKFGVGPDRVVDVQALAGDSTDNVPGVPGIGVKTAAELVNAFGDLDSLLARAGEIRQPKRRETLLANADKARISRELVRLKDDCELPEELDALARRRPDPAVLRAFLEAQAFRTLLARFQADGSVVVVQVGFFTNLARLLDDAEARALVAKKVSRLSLMGGAFQTVNADTRYLEYNVKVDIPAAQKLARDWPTPMARHHRPPAWIACRHAAESADPQVQAAQGGGSRQGDSTQGTRIRRARRLCDGGRPRTHGCREVRTRAKGH
jgi:5'-3' exonuclease